VLTADGLQVALRQADHAIELGQFARFSSLDILYAGIETQQLCIRRIARLLRLQPGELFGGSPTAHREAETAKAHRG